ncbi:hypothetical protein HDU93_008870, partial [Gonapodya sp. JEL0774]
ETSAVQWDHLSSVQTGHLATSRASASWLVFPSLVSCSSLSKTRGPSGSRRERRLKSRPKP